MALGQRPTAQAGVCHRAPLPNWGTVGRVTDVEIGLLAEEALDRLYEQEPETATRVDDMIDRLIQDPGHRQVRERRIRGEVRPGLPETVWGFTIRGRSDNYLVTWYALPYRLVVATLTRDVL